MATYSDDFSTNKLGTDYDHYNSGLVRIGSAAYGRNGLTTLSAVKTSVSALADDHESQVTMTVAASSDFCGPAVRVTAGSGNAYVLNGDTFATRRLATCTAGVVANIGSVNIAATTGDVFRLRVTGSGAGSVIQWWKNGALMETLNGNTAFSTGKPGLYYSWQDSGVARLDDFSATDELTASAIARISSGYHTRNINR